MSFLGIDAGGSKTRLILAEDEKALAGGEEDLKKARLEGLNVSTHGRTGVTAFVEKLPDHIQLSDPAKVKIFGGFAGIETEAQADEVLDIFAQYGFSRHNVTAVNDSQLWLEAMSGDGIVLALGTGSVCVAKFEEQIYRKGGWGFALGDEASGYYFGQRAINFAVHQQEKWPGLPESVLIDAVREQFGVSDLREILPRVYGPSRATVPEIAALAPKVLQLASAGDLGARSLVLEGGNLAADHVRAICLEAKVTQAKIGLIGGIFDSPDSALLRSFIAERLTLVGLTIDFVELGEGEGREDPLLLAMKNHFGNAA